MTNITGRYLAVAYGGGVNSTAFLIEFARLGIVPGLILFSDTGGERPETYAFIKQFSVWLESYGMPAIQTVVKGVKKGFPVETLEQNCVRKKMLPSIAYGYKTCSEKFKIRAQEKFIRHYPETKAIIKAIKTGGPKILKVIGYDAGEPGRAKPYVHHEYDYWYPLVEWGWDREKCIEVVKSAGFHPAKSSCFFCLAGETEVVTDAGLRPIRDLAGTEPVLLVPCKNGCYKAGEHGGNEYQTRGTWQKAEVREFGEQELYAVELRRNNRTKVIRGTAEHRWFKADGAEVTTLQLKGSGSRRACYGDRLALCQRPTVALEAEATRPKPSPFGIAQGFVYGDGSRSLANRPVRLRFYGDKDKAMLKWFSSCDLTEDKLPDGTKVPVAAEIPRFWKELPPIQESSSFLLGWLAGYFAADGNLSSNGTPSLESVSLASLRFARNVCHMLGVRCSEVVGRQRKGYNGLETLYRLTFSVKDVPESFWLIPAHRAFAEKCLKRKTLDNRHWHVVSVRPLGVKERVYCAVVEGAGRFALADHLLTGNCPSMTKPEIKQLAEEHPDLLQRALALEDNAKENLETVKGLGRRFNWREFIQSLKAGDPNACKWDGDVEVPCGCYDG